MAGMPTFFEDSTLIFYMRAPFGEGEEELLL